jgi:hypothetical protein
MKERVLVQRASCARFKILLRSDYLARYFTGEEAGRIAAGT